MLPRWGGVLGLGCNILRDPSPRRMNAHGTPCAGPCMPRNTRIEERAITERGWAGVTRATTALVVDRTRRWLSLRHR